MYLCLLTYRNHKDGTCWPTVPMLAEDCGLSERSVQESIKHLGEIGWLTVTKRPGRRADFTGNLYSVLSPEEVVERCKKCTDKGAETSPLKVQKTSSKGAKSAAKLVPVTSTKITPPFTPQGKKNEPTIDDVDVELTNALRDLNRTRIADWNFAGKPEKHYHEMHLLRTRGNANNGNRPVSDERIRAVLNWLATDDFWIPKGNVQSVSKFREKFVQFEMKAATPAKQNGKRFTPAVPGSIPEQTFSYPEPPAALLAEWQAGLEKLRIRFAERGGSLTPEQRLAALAGLTPISRSGDGVLRIGARDRNTARFAREYYGDDLAAVFGQAVIEP